MSKEINDLKQNAIAVNYQANTEVATLAASSGTKQGIAYHGVDKGYFISTISATLPDPPQGFVYQTWLVRENLNTDADIMPTGRMQLESPQDHFWAAVFSSKVNYSDYRKVVIALEPDTSQDFHEPAGKNILVGQF